MKKVERALYQSKYKSIYGVPVAEKKKKVHKPGSKGAVKESHTHHWGKFLKMGTDEARLNRSSSFQCRCW